MIDTLIVAYERTKELKETVEKSFNWKYGHFFDQMNEFLTQTFKCFNFLINDIRKFYIFKHEFFLVLKLIDSLNDKWEYHVEVYHPKKMNNFFHF